MIWRWRVAAAAFIAFIPALTAGFCSLRRPGRGLVRSAATADWGREPAMDVHDEHMGHYQPLTWFRTRWIPAVGDESFGFHLTNVVIHAFNTALVYLLARRLNRGRLAGGRIVGAARTLEAGAALAALLFGIHPLRVESVAWITERRDWC